MVYPCIVSETLKTLYPVVEWMVWQIWQWFPKEVWWWFLPREVYCEVRYAPMTTARQPKTMISHLFHCVWGLIMISPSTITHYTTHISQLPGNSPSRTAVWQADKAFLHFVCVDFWHEFTVGLITYLFGWRWRLANIFCTWFHKESRHCLSSSHNDNLRKL